MIKAIIQNSPYCTEIRFPVYALSADADNAETELSRKLGELGLNTEHLAPIGTVIEIEPAELLKSEDIRMKQEICPCHLEKLSWKPLKLFQKSMRQIIVGGTWNCLTMKLKINLWIKSFLVNGLINALRIY